jgi:hypothetical protein
LIYFPIYRTSYFESNKDLPPTSAATFCYGKYIIRFSFFSEKTKVSALRFAVNEPNKKKKAEE